MLTLFKFDNILVVWRKRSSLFFS